jgi:DNA-damage-inducible protein D
MSLTDNAVTDHPLTPFERIRQEDEDGAEFWSARDLMPILEYTNWRNFKAVLLKAQIACENSGSDPSDHFTGAIKMVAIGSDAKREVEDMHLSRYACYLIVQNADPTKEVVALGQTYFAVQTRRQENGGHAQPQMDIDPDEIDPVESFRRGWEDGQVGRRMSYEAMKAMLARER